MSEASHFTTLDVLADVNPNTALPMTGMASFVGMEDVSESFELINSTARAITHSGGYTRFKEGDLLFAKITPCMENGKGAEARGLVYGIGFGSTEFHVLRPKDPSSRRFIAQWLQSAQLRYDAEAFMSGSAGQRRVPSSFFSRYQIPSLLVLEQQRIAEILDTLDEQIRKSKEILGKLKLVKQGLLDDLLTRGIDENGELRDSKRQPDQFIDSPVGRIPRAWDVGPAAKWCERLTVGVVNSATTAYVNEGVPFIRSQNVRPNRIDTHDLIYITHEFNRQQAKSILKTGDVVIVRTGYPGTAAVVPPSLEGSNCFSLVVASPKVNRLDSEFLAQYLNSPACKRQIDRMHFGSAQHNFNVGEMRRLPMALPQAPEQGRIVGVLLQHDRRQASEEQGLSKLRLLKDALTRDLLTGRVRVPMEVRT